MDRTSLSQRLKLSFFGTEFFRPLSLPSAPLYVDCAERLVEEAAEAGRLRHAEVLAIIREVVANHPGIQLEEDEGMLLRDIRHRAGAFFGRLLASGWLEEQTLGLQDRWAVISPGLRPLLRLLQQLAEEDAAELQTFADTLRSVVLTLAQPGILDPDVRSADEMRSTVTDLNQRLDHAIDQLHAVEKLVSGFEQRQRQSASPAETLQLFYDEFGQGQHMVCYDVLRRGGLLPSLQKARSLVATQRDDPFMRDRLAAGIQAHYHLDENAAYQRAGAELGKLERSLGGLRQRAEAIDARMASFNRMSQQRYKYQTELRGRRPEIVKEYCERVNRQFSGKKFNDLNAEATDFAPRAPAVKFYFGTDSLWRRRKAKAPADLSFGGSRSADVDEAAALEAWKERNRLALTPQRAARLLTRLVPARQGKIFSNAFALETSDELLDLLALVAYEQAPSESGSLTKWSVQTPRTLNGLRPDSLAASGHAGWQVEQFEIERTS